MRQSLKKLIKAFSLELLLYGVLMAVYAWVVLRFLSGWLYELFKSSHVSYALTALALIVVQGLILEMLARGLLEIFKGRRGK